MALARNEAALRELVAEIRVQGGRAAYAVCDVGGEEDVARAVEVTTATFGLLG